MPYCQHEKGHWYSKERINGDWDENAKEFIKNGDWNYNFSDEATVSDPEQSFLCRYVYSTLMDVAIDSIKPNKIHMTKGDITYHFDVMNNYNDASAGFIAGYKYTIGNFAPIPDDRFKYQTGGREYHLQIIHKWLNEKWDKLLDFLQKKWPCKSPTFADYIISTCQQLYINDIFNDFYEENKELKKIDWIETVNEWNRKIPKNETLTLVSFDDSDESRKKINFIIEARGRCILSLANPKIQSSKH